MSDLSDYTARLFGRPEPADETPVDPKPDNFVPREGNNPRAEGNRSMQDFVRTLFSHD